jgi:gamma-glutamylcyclotransferase (GGCT)/AIG2-like uncharacterized protein YtfP
VRGSLIDAGWGAELGYPALILDPDGPEIEVFVFESKALLDHWDRLDAFEGPGYRRVTVDVSTPEGVLPASIYVLANRPGPWWRPVAAVNSARFRFPVWVSLCGVHLLGKGGFAAVFADAFEVLAFEHGEA